MGDRKSDIQKCLEDTFDESYQWYTEESYCWAENLD